MTPFIILAIGFLLIFLEFFLPGGIMGAIGAVVVLASIVVFVVQYDSPVAIILYIIGTTLALVFLFRFALWRITHSKPEYSVYSNSHQEGYVASAFDKEAIGKTGVVSSDLKPGGHIIVDGKKHLAISQNGYISKGEKVVVLDGQGESLIVKRKG